MRWLSLLALPLVLNSCGGGYGRVGLMDAPKVVNVSSYDPKEKQRPGDSFSSADVSALRRNGAHGLIARTGKGTELDDKCGDFLSAASREGMLLGTYYRVLPTSDAVWQADRYIARLREIVAARGLQGRKILLVGDFNTESKASNIVRFVERVRQLTGVTPVIYLENGDAIRGTLRSATSAEKRVIGQCPYWLALYGPSGSFRTPQDLTDAHGIWGEWVMWQYAGVEWKSGRSVAKHYHHGPWRSPEFFGTMDRPLEHNAFNGSVGELRAFWAAHSWQP
jgi:GH25 family lysozyme M1 (1,4-beta-N-acetylmuramidase)